MFEWMQRRHAEEKEKEVKKLLSVSVQSNKNILIILWLFTAIMTQKANKN